MRLDCSYKMVTQVDPPNLQGDYLYIYIYESVSDIFGV